jgi:Carboxypeptidase regulatory-like domain
VQTGLSRELITDASGFYRGISLPSGSYEVSAGLDGFTTLKQSGIQLSIGQALDVDAVLKLAAVAAEVSVEATSPALELTKTEVSSTVNRARYSRAADQWAAIYGFRSPHTQRHPGSAWALWISERRSFLWRSSRHQ